MADASGLEAMRSSSQSAPSLASLRATRPALPKPVRGGAQRLPAVAGVRKPPAKKPSSAPKRVTIAEPGEDAPEAPGAGAARGRAVGAFNLAKPKPPNLRRPSPGSLNPPPTHWPRHTKPNMVLRWNTPMPSIQYVLIVLQHRLPCPTMPPLRRKQTINI